MSHSYKVNCLSTKYVWGKLINLHSHFDANSPIILVSKKLTVKDVQRILSSSTMPQAVLVENGSFAGHPSVFLNNHGIQLVVINHIPEDYAQYYACVDGVEEKIYFDTSESNSKNQFRGFQKETLPTTWSKKVKYKGEIINVNVDGKTPEDIKKGLALGASGVGILRTEWLGWDNKNPPSIAEHYKLYSDCLKVLKGKRLNIRLFDIGGDKIPNWATSAKIEINSPLGLRGIRANQILSQAFDNQLLAIAKLVKNNKLGVVLPMISFPEELDNFIKHFDDISGGLSKKIEWGSMVETPSSALLIKDIYKFADFVRIGPGDLSQFTLATIRENISPKYLSGDTLSLAVLKLIKNVMAVSRKNNKEANMCLDVEPRLPLLRKLLAVGVRTFNVSPLNVPTVFSLISKIS